MGQINRHLVLGELCVEPVEKFDSKQGIQFQLVPGQFRLRQDLGIAESRVLGLANEPSLRESAAQSPGKGGFAVEHRPRQLAVHHRIGENQASARLQHPVQFPEGQPLFG